jgi:DNA-binding CsgD family transcriptional regulator
MTPLTPVLSDREELVLLMLADGHGLREIADRLGVTVWTIRAHRDNAKRKLCVGTTTHAVAIVVRMRAEAPVG